MERRNGVSGGRKSYLTCPVSDRFPSYDLYNRLLRSVCGSPIHEHGADDELARLSEGPTVTFDPQDEEERSDQIERVAPFTLRKGLVAGRLRPIQRHRCRLPLRDLRAD